MSQVTVPTWEEWTTSGAWASADTRSLPLSPGTLGDVLWLVRDPDVDAARLIRFISRDQAMAARVLRLANVAAYAPMVEVTSIGQAVVRLGTESVRRAMLAVCFQSWAQPLDMHSGKIAELIAHAVVTASIARHVATATSADPDEVFAQGLLHDIGKLFLLRLRADYMRKTGKSPAPEELAHVETVHHAEIGGMAMQLWGLPLVLREPICWHHDPLSAPTFPRAAAIIYVANTLAHRYTDRAERTLDLAGDPAMTGLGLTEAWLARTDAQSTRLLAGADTLVRC